MRVCMMPLVQAIAPQAFLQALVIIIIIIFLYAIFLFQLIALILFSLGMAVARDLLGKNNSVVSVIGDGAMTAGQAYEAMNNAGFLDSNLIVVLNDNKQVSLPTATLDGPATPVGALSSALTKLQSSPKFRQLREAAKVIYINSLSLSRSLS